MILFVLLIVAVCVCPAWAYFGSLFALVARSLHFVESALFSRGAERAAETATILVREFARRDKIALQFSLLHVMKVRASCH